MKDFVAKNKAFLGTVALGAAGVGLYYYYTHMREGGFDNPYPKPVVVDVLKDFRREFNKVNVALFQQVSRVKQFLRANGRQFDSSMKDEFQAMLVDNNPEFGEQMEEIEDRVYQKHGITDKVRFQKTCEITYKLDPEINLLMKGMQRAFDSVMGGEPPQVEAVVPPEMTAELTLSIVTKSAEEYLKAFLNLAEQFLKKGQKPTQNNLEFVNSLRGISPEEFKLKIMREKGIDRLSDDPEAMFSKAIQTYIEKDQTGFRMKMYDLESRNKAVMSAVLNGTANIDMIEKFRQELYAPPKGAIAEVTAQLEEEIEGEKPAEDDQKAAEDEVKAADHDVEIKPTESIVLNSNHLAESTKEDTMGHSDAKEPEKTEDKPEEVIPDEVIEA